LAARLENEQHNDDAISREEQQNLEAFRFSLVTHINKKKPNKSPRKGTYSTGFKVGNPKPFR
jgi:hypothetical protein